MENVTRLLNDSDFQQISDLLDRKIKSSPESLSKWKENIKNFFLVGEQYKVFGYFIDGNIQSMLGIRHIGPNGVVVSWTVSENNNNSLAKIIECFSKFADNNKINNIFYVTSTKRVEQYLRYIETHIPEYYAKYETVIMCEIPAGTQPKDDLWWGMMGRTILPHDASIVNRRRINQF